MEGFYDVLVLNSGSAERTDQHTIRTMFWLTHALEIALKKTRHWERTGKLGVWTMFWVTYALAIVFKKTRQWERAGKLSFRRCSGDKRRSWRKYWSTHNMDNILVIHAVWRTDKNTMWTMFWLYTRSGEHIDQHAIWIKFTLNTRSEDRIEHMIKGGRTGKRRVQPTYW